jgi:hypothetical protein
MISIPFSNDHNRVNDVDLYSNKDIRSYKMKVDTNMAIDNDYITLLIISNDALKI